VIVRIGDEIDGLAVDTGAGGRICSLILSGRERILAEPAEGIESSIAWGCYLMAPFVGRLSGGSVDWHGRHGQLPRNLGRHSIHGAVFDRAWTVAEQAPNALAVSCAFDPLRWPFRGATSQRLQIERGRLRLEAEIRAEEPMPAALGWHPWFLDSENARVTLQSDAVLQVDPGLIPTGERVDVDTRTDLRSGPAMAGRRLDDVYVGVRAPAKVTWPDFELTMDFDAPIGCFVVFVHPQAICVEPMTAWPDSIRLAAAGRQDTGLVSLGAGEKLAASTTWTWEATERAEG
jgi:aldose 1-epimerase